MYNIASEDSYQDGQIIFKEGSSGDWVCVVLSGQVELSKTVGGKKSIIAILRPEQVFGELGFIGGIKRTVTARAIGETTVGVIDRSSLDTEFNSLSSEFRSILVSIVKRFEQMINRASDFRTRKDERVQKTLSLTFKTPAAFVEAFSSNLGTGGLFVRTENPLPEGERFFIKLQHPGASLPIRKECEVVWRRGKGAHANKGPPGMGVKFCDMTEKDHKVLKQYLADILKGGKRR